MSANQASSTAIAGSFQLRVTSDGVPAGTEVAGPVTVRLWLSVPGTTATARSTLSRPWPVSQFCTITQYVPPAGFGTEQDSSATSLALLQTSSSDEGWPSPFESRPT